MGLLCLQPQDRHIQEAVLGPSAPCPSGPDNSPLTPLQTAPASLSPELEEGAEPLAGTCHRTSISICWGFGGGGGGDAAKTPRIGQTVGAEAEKRRNWRVASEPAGAERGGARGSGRERAAALPCPRLEGVPTPLPPPLSSTALTSKLCHSHFTGGKGHSQRRSDMLRATSSGSLPGTV